MKLSSKSRYGLNAMYHLALNNPEEYLNLTELSKRTNISQPYLEKVMGMLKQKGLIEANRGVQGGYKLTNEPSNTTIGQILRVFESDLIFADCSRSSGCTNFNCPSKGIYKMIYGKLNKFLDELTLQDMIDNKGDIL
jgi:Rrf2 family protein